MLCPPLFQSQPATRLSPYLFVGFLSLCGLLLQPGCAFFGFQSPTQTQSPNGQPKGPKALYALGQEAVESSNDARAQEIFQSIQATFPDSSFAPLSLLALADLHASKKQTAEAVAAYRRFLRFYPDHTQSPYAMRKIGETYTQEIPGDWFFLPPSREKDQGRIRQAERAFAALQTRFPDHPQSLAAEATHKKLRRRLADHELYVARFYFKRRRYPGALLRAEKILKQYPNVALQDQALWIVGQSAQKLENNPRAQEAFAKLIAEHPDSPLLKDAQRALKKMPRKPPKAAE